MLKNPLYSKTHKLIPILLRTSMNVPIAQPHTARACGSATTLAPTMDFARFADGK